MAPKLSSTLPLLVPLALSACGSNVHELQEGAVSRNYCETGQDGARVCVDPVIKLLELRKEFSAVARNCADGRSIIDKRRDVWDVVTDGTGYDGSDWRVMSGSAGCHASMGDDFRDAQGGVWVLPDSNSTAEPVENSGDDTLLAQEGKK